MDAAKIRRNKKISRRVHGGKLRNNSYIFSHIALGMSFVFLCDLSALRGERNTMKRSGASFWQAQLAGPRLREAV